MAIFNMIYKKNGGLTYSYDFKNKTISSIQSDGWVLNTTSYASSDANGLICSSWTAIHHNLLIPNTATNIIISSTSKVTASGHDSFFGISTVPGDSAGTQNGMYHYANGVTAIISSTDHANSISVGAGTYNRSINLDLVNKTAVFKLGNNTYNYTLTGTDINGIKQAAYIKLFLARSVYIQDYSITIK